MFEDPAPGAPPATPPAGGATTPPAADAQDVSSLPEWAQKALREARTDAGNYRTKATDRDALAAKLKTLEDAQLSEADKLTKRAAELEEATKTTANELRQERAEREVERTARKLNVIDEDAALALIRAKIEFDASGKPTNIEPLLKQLITDKPWLLGQAAGQPAGNPGNPAGVRTGPMTAEHFKGKSSAYINEHWDEYVKTTAQQSR